MGKELKKVEPVLTRDEMILAWMPREQEKGLWE